jgi:hypothetical protein
VCQDDRELQNAKEPSPQHLDELEKHGFAKFGDEGELQFSMSWKLDRLDAWLRESLPVTFERMDVLMANIEDPPVYPWHLVKVTCSHLTLHWEIPDIHDFCNAKGGKSKSWLENKIYLGQ